MDKRQGQSDQPVRSQIQWVLILQRMPYVITAALSRTDIFDQNITPKETSKTDIPTLNFIFSLMIVVLVKVQIREGQTVVLAVNSREIKQGDGRTQGNQSRRQARSWGCWAILEESQFVNGVPN